MMLIAVCLIPVMFTVSCGKVKEGSRIPSF
jgi:hypothetical protein